MFTLIETTRRLGSPTCCAASPTTPLCGSIGCCPAIGKATPIKPGFGFIGPDQGGKDIFVHASVLERSGITGLEEGQRVAVDVPHRSRARSDTVDRL
jgi:cold shock protein